VAGSGGLDPSFGTSGTTVLEHPTSTYPTPTKVTADGKIIAVTTDNGVITVSRLLPNGAPDPSFDGDGQAVIESPGSPSARAAAVQPDGKIVIVGFKSVGAGEEDAMVWRLKADGGSGAVNGALDPGFGVEGAVALKPDTDNVANAVTIQPDGKVLVTGSIFNMPSGKNTGAVWRLTESGALDPTFDTHGLAEVSDAHEDIVEAIAVAPDGKIVIAGDTTDASNPPDVVVWRLMPNGGAGALNGARDLTFDTDGQADIDSGGEDRARSVVVQPDGKIVVVGSSDRESHSQATIWRLKVDGGPGGTSEGLDPTFDTDGAAQIDGGGNAEASDVALQPDGKILVAGDAQAGTGPYGAVLWRLQANGGNGAVNGALDPAFGSGGALTVSSGTGAVATALALEPDRRIVVGGATFSEGLLLFRALGDPYSATVTKAGAGSGTVVSGPAGVACGSICTAPFDDGSAVTLTATPASGSAFAGWSGGGCSGTGTCTLTMSADRAVTATFNASPAASPTKAKLSFLHESNSVFAAGPSSTPLSAQSSAKRHKRGTVFSFRLDQAATVSIAIRRSLPGRRVGRRCRAAGHHLRHKPRCTRTVTVKTLIRSSHAGRNQLAFSGRFNGKALPPGRYQAVFTARDGAGASAAQTLTFTIVKH
jgi:uncharacterized delta-60 repeat protein